MPRYNRKVIEEYLPFRGHSLLLDEVFLYKDGNKVTAKKILTGKELFFKGHFPGNPIMPGHLIAESMAQASAVFFIKKFGKLWTSKQRLFYLASSKMRFFRSVRPKATLNITVYPVKVLFSGGIFKAEAYVSNKLVAKGEFTIAVK